MQKTEFKLLSELEEENKEYIEILNKRYTECDSQGHLKPKKRKNFCDHCYRHLEYPTPETDAELRRQRELPSHQQPCNAPIMIERANRERGFQEGLDFWDGVNKIREELESKVENS